MGTREPIERRKQKRSKSREGAFVALRLRGSKLGQIVDISARGLAFRYIDIGERPRGTFELDILFRDKEFHLERVPAKTVSDSESAEAFPFSATKTRRHSVQFGDLTDDQVSQLAYFIKHYTT